MDNKGKEVELKLPKLEAGDILKIAYFHCISFTHILDTLSNSKIEIDGKKVYQMRMKNVIKELEKELYRFGDCFSSYYYKNEDESGTLYKCSENVTNILRVISLCSIEELGTIGYLGNLATVDKAKFNTLTIGILGSNIVEKK